MFLRSARSAPPALLNEVVKKTTNRGVSDGRLAKLADSSPLGRIFAAGLKNIKTRPDVMKESIQEAGRRVSHDLTRFPQRPGYDRHPSAHCWTVRTVIGMIEIFGSQNPAGNSLRSWPTEFLWHSYNTAFGADRGDSQHDFYRHFRAGSKA